MYMRNRLPSARRGLPVAVAGALTAALVVTGTGAATAAVPASVKMTPAAVNLNNPTKALCKL